MAKGGFKNNNPLTNLNTETPVAEVPTEPDTKPQEHTETPKAAVEKPKRKVGRPKTKDVKGTCKNINVAVPITLLEQWEDVKVVHGSNLTAYITKLIERDMSDNYDKYKTLADGLNNI